ncbi:MAG: 3-oxoadipate enol-lactonase [Myxococcota bacterium]|jgi:3-oxoadipate enol-lactonase
MPLTPTWPRLHYEVYGTSGPPVLFVMGLGMSAAAWRPQVEALAHDHRCLVFDNRGIGRSGTAPGLWTIPDLADDALRVLEVVGWPQAHLVGVSMGAMVSRQLAAAQPQRWHSLTLIAAHAGPRRLILPTPRALQLFARAQAGEPAARVAALNALLFPPDWLATTDTAQLNRRMESRVGTPPGPATLGRQLGAVLRYGGTSNLDQIRAPALIVKPAADILVPPANSDLLAAGIRRAELVEFRDAGHGITLQCADRLNRALRGHIREHGTPM